MPRYAAKRQKPRQPYYNARIATEPNAPQIKCQIADVSKGGAHIVLENDQELAASFLLLFTPTGYPRRNCDLIWHDGTDVGVRFTEE